MRQPFDNINKQEKQNLLKDLEANSITFEKNELVLKKVKNNNFIGIIIYGFGHSFTLAWAFSIFSLPGWG